MPINVPRREGGLVSTAPLPIVHPGAAFQPAPAINLDPLTKAVGDLFQEKRDQADQIAVIGADAQLAAAQNSLLFDPKAGALNRKGKDALYGQLDAEDAWKKTISGIELGLSNDRQKIAFARAAANREEDFSRALMGHVSKELNAYRAEQTQANLDAEFGLIAQNYTDPARVQQGIDHQRAVIMLDGRLTGESKEVTENRIAEATSRSRAAVVQLTLNAGDDLTAQKYFDQHRDQITTSDQLRLDPQLELGSVRGESQRHADAILGTTQMMDAAMKRAALLPDPRVRQATEERIRQAYSDRATEARQESADAFRQARQILEQTGDIHRIPPALLLKLSPEDNSSLQHRQDQIRNPKRITDPDLYSSLMNMAGISDQSRAAFEQLNLSQYRDRLSEGDYQRLLRIQLSARTRTGSAIAGEARRQSAAAEKDAARQRTWAEALETLRILGIDVPAPVPGAPIRIDRATPPANFDSGRQSPTAPPAAGGKVQRVPQAWLDRAKRDPNYRLYLQHMGVQVP